MESRLASTPRLQRRLRVHSDGRAAESARAVNGVATVGNHVAFRAPATTSAACASKDGRAPSRRGRCLAYTVGNHLAFDSGQYAPGTSGGRGLLAHELAHVVQQGSGAAALQRAIRVGSPADEHERRADQAAAAVMGGRSAAVMPTGTAPTLQRRCVGGRWQFEYDGCSLPKFVSDMLGIADKDNPAGGRDTQFAFGLPTALGGDACDRHDECYQTCNPLGKAGCDARMYADMVRICLASSEGLAVKASCLRWAGIYYTGLRLGGRFRFYPATRPRCAVAALCSRQPDPNADTHPNADSHSHTDACPDSPTRPADAPGHPARPGHACAPQSGDVAGDRIRMTVNTTGFLNAGEQSRFETVADDIKLTGDTVEVHGLASTDGPTALNDTLSCNRALAGVRLLTGRGVAAAKINGVFKHGEVVGPAVDMRSIVLVRAAGGRRPPPGPETITSETVVTDPAPRTRTTVGVGEEVDMTHAPGTATWATTAGTLSATTGVTVRLTAPDTAQRVTVTGDAARIEFNVLAPTSVAMDREPGTGVKHTRNSPDSGVQTRVFLGPDTVNFSRVRYRERDVGATTTGTYTCFGPTTPHCGAGVGNPCPDKALTSTVVAGMGTQSVLGDCAYSGHCGGTAPFAPGSLSFSIPYEYRVPPDPFHAITTVAQVHTLAADASTLTSSKAGANGTTTVAAATVTIAACP